MRKLVFATQAIDPADPVPARLPVHLELAEQRHGVAGHRGHHVRRVELEDQPRRVRRRAAGLQQRPLVDEDDVGPALPGEVVGHAGAGDAGPDDHHTGGSGQRLAHAS